MNVAICRHACTSQISKKKNTFNRHHIDKILKIIFLSFHVSLLIILLFIKKNVHFLLDHTLVSWSAGMMVVGLLPYVGQKGSKSGKDFETEIICPSISLIVFLWIITRSKFLYNLKYYVSYTQQLSIKKKQRLLLYIKTLYSVNRYVCYELVLLSRLKTIDCWIKLIFKIWNQLT